MHKLMVWLDLDKVPCNGQNEGIATTACYENQKEQDNKSTLQAQHPGS